MRQRKTLRRTRQCGKCPWRCATNPRDIPNGYSVEMHRNLANTIATPGAIFLTGRAMACHESETGDEDMCVGWLAHQLGRGNNIGLRLHMAAAYEPFELHLDGDQHARFEDTIPGDDDR